MPGGRQLKKFGFGWWHHKPQLLTTEKKSPGNNPEKFITLHNHSALTRLFMPVPKNTQAATNRQTHTHTHIGISIAAQNTFTQSPAPCLD